MSQRADRYKFESKLSNIDWHVQRGGDTLSYEAH